MLQAYRHGSRVRHPLPDVGGANVLIMGSSATPNAGEFANKLGLYLALFGAQITHMVASEANLAGNIAGRDLVILVRSATSAAYGDTARAWPGPLITCNSAHWANAVAGFCTTVGTTTSQTQFEVLSPVHPLLTALPTGSAYTYSTAASAMPRGSAWQSSAQLLLEAVSGTNVCLAAFEKGAAIDAGINGGVCAGRRVCNGIEPADAYASVLPVAWGVWGGAINWVMGA